MQIADDRLEVPEAVGRLPGLSITRDGVQVGPGQWGVPLPADMGSHVIVIEATGRQRIQTTFDILADVSSQVALDFPASSFH